MKMKEMLKNAKLLRSTKSVRVRERIRISPGTLLVWDPD